MCCRGYGTKCVFSYSAGTAIIVVYRGVISFVTKMTLSGAKDPKPVVNK